MRRPSPSPAWLTHPLRGLRGPVPWGAVLRGALGVGPLLAAGVAAGRPADGVAAGLGAMFAHINDRPATRRTRIARIGLPALCGAAGLVAGGWIAAVGLGWWTAVALAAVGLVSGSLSAIGPVCSSAGVQLMVMTILGAGMPSTQSPAVRALLLIGGAAWVVAMAALIPHGRSGARHERGAVAAVYDALAELLAAVGTTGGPAARRRLTAAYDTAYEALYVHRLPLRRPDAGERRLRDQLAVAAAFGEAAVALLWEGGTVPARVVRAPSSLARAVRDGAPPGRLAAPAPDTAGRLAMHRAVLLAARVFDGAPAPAVGASGTGIRHRVRRALGPAGREYAARVALCVGVGTVLAQVLRQDHWYWLPATTVFLVKPDMGPLFSRAVSRAFGTAVGVIVFGTLAALLSGVRAPWPVAVAAVCAALVPVSVRHFALQTAVLTPLLLALVYVDGDTGAACIRLTETLLGCAVVLAAGALPGLGGPRAQVSVRLSLAVRATGDHLDAALAGGRPYPQRLRLRREAYRALAEARRAVELASAEHPPFGRDLAAWAPVVAALEAIVDTASACAIRLDHGAPPPDAAHTAALRAALSDLADAVATRRPPDPALPLPSATATDGCATLTDLTSTLRRARALATVR